MDKIETQGRVAPGLESVRDAFAANFASGEDTGASFAVQIDGETMVDLWAGQANDKTGEAWGADTIVPVFSAGKAVCAVIMAMLAERGKIDYDAPLSDLWPDFAQAGKGAVTIAQALSHQGGVPGFREEMDPQIWFDQDAIAAKLAAEAPYQPVGAPAYHAMTFGIIVQEIARRADGRTIGTILREDIAEPFHLDLQIGTPETEHHRVAKMIKPRGFADFGEITPETRAAFLQPWSSPGGRGGADWRMAEFPAANCHANARSLAAFMAVLANGGVLDGQRLISAETLTALTQERVSGQDHVLPVEISWAAGLIRNRPAYADWFGPNESAVGHYGFGGSMAMADAEAHLSAAYVMNQQGRILIGDERARRILRALYSAL